MERKVNFEGIINRRDFLKAAALATTAAGGVALASTPGLPASPKRGETLTIAIDKFGEDSWLVHKFGNASLGPPTLVYEFLLYTDPQDPLKLIPGLAESWSHKDFKEWTFKIRKGVQWDKGQGELTAEDVAFSLATIARQDAVAIDAPFWRPRLKNMKVVDRYTLTFSFPTVEPLIALKLSGYARSQIMCKKYVESVGLDKADREPVGSGPYRLTKYVQGVEAELQAIDRPHWRVAPKWGRIIFRCVPENTTRLAALATQTADIALVGLDHLDEVKRRGFPVYHVELITALAIQFGGLFSPRNPKYTGKEPWHDIRIREAMAIAIDRAAINKTFFSGVGTYEGMPGVNVAPLKTLAPYPMPYDPERAKRLIKEAGREHIAVKMLSFPIPGMPQVPHVMEAVAGYWQAIGLKTEITPMDRTAFRARWLKNETHDLVYPWNGTIVPVYEWRIEKFFYCKSSGAVYYCDAHADSVYEKLATIADDDTRMKVLTDLQVYLRRQWAGIQIVNVPQVVFAALPSKVGSWKPRMVSDTTFWEYLEPA